MADAATVAGRALAPANSPTADRIERHRGDGAVDARAAVVRAEGEPAEYTRAIERARQWLSSAKGDVTEERAFRLLGLTWAEAGEVELKAAARDLLSLQRSDGGWSQEPLLASDAYATGEAVTALRESGMAAADDPAVRRAVEFLLRTQLRDGSWYVNSRSVPIQAYFESGFPHGADQWISAAGTAWAVRALANVH